MESSHVKKLWAVLIPAMLLPGLASLWYFVWLGDSPLAQVTYGSVKVFTLVWPIIAIYLILKEKIHFQELSIQEHLQSIPMGIMIGLPIAVVIGLLMLSPIGSVVKEASPLVKQKCIDLGIINHFILFGLVISIFHSLLEEYYWRWFVYGKLREVVKI
ncbi:MAG: hypothetical protein VXW02_09685, partial [Verrucomicrobiota bacterium]|nr:hypothetical protein [Verrucomicrobiota bacterium]